MLVRLCIWLKAPKYYFCVFENNYFHAQVHTYSFLEQSILSSMAYCANSSNSDDILAILFNVSYVIYHLVLINIIGYTLRTCFLMKTLPSASLYPGYGLHKTDSGSYCYKPDKYYKKCDLVLNRQKF